MEFVGEIKIRGFSWQGELVCAVVSIEWYAPQENRFFWLDFSIGDRVYKTIEALGVDFLCFDFVVFVDIFWRRVRIIIIIFNLKF